MLLPLSGGCCFEGRCCCYRKLSSRIKQFIAIVGLESRILSNAFNLPWKALSVICHAISSMRKLLTGTKRGAFLSGAVR